MTTTAASTTADVPAVLLAPPWTRPRPAEPVVTGLRCTDPPAADFRPGEHDAMVAAERARWRPVIVPEGAAGLPGLLGTVLDAPASYAELLLPFTSPAIATIMAEWLVRSRSPRVRSVARQWLTRHPHAAARALVPAAVGEPGPARRLAGHALRTVAAEDRDTVLAAAATYGAAVAAATAATIDTDPLDLLPDRIPAPPRWAGVDTLPAVRLRDSTATLPPAAARHLVTMLAMSRLTAPYAGLEPVRAACEPRSLAAFGWALFQRWQDAAMPSAGRWALDVQGLIGDDETVRRLAPVIRSWPGFNEATRAATGLDVLVAIGSDVALVHLHGVAEKAKAGGVRKLANRRLADAAEAAGLTMDQLGDRLVPDLGLGPDGSLTLSYGPRRFTVGFDEQLKPYVVDDDGRRRKDLPKPGAKDDPTLAPAAHQRFAGLKKDVRTIATDQLRRLERAMSTQRRWPAAEFQRFFVEQPLLWHLARRLVWAAYTGPSPLAFRLAEDRSPADAADEPVTVPPDAPLGIAHPFDLGPTLPAWTELFADYEILQPFPQLDRPTHRLSAEDLAATTLPTFTGRPTTIGRLLPLERRGWHRSQPGDGGIQDSLERPLPGGLTLTVSLEPGIFVGDVAGLPDQTLGAVTISGPGQPPPTFAAVPPVQLSECLRDLNSCL